MLVKMLRNPAAAFGCRIPEGETGKVDPMLGRKLVSLGLAVCVDPPQADPPPVIRAVPEPPAVAQPEPPAIQPTPTPQERRPMPAAPLNVRQTRKDRRNDR